MNATLSEEQRTEIKQAALALSEAEGKYERAKAEFDQVVQRLIGSRNAVSHQPALTIDAPPQLLVSGPLTNQILSILRAERRIMHNRELAAILSKSPEVVGATLSNLKREGQVINPSRGAWRIKE